MADSWVFATRPAGVVKGDKNQTDSKMACVSLFMNKPRLHLRSYHGKRDNLMPSPSALVLTKEGFLNLILLKDDILQAFEKLEQSHRT